MGFVENLRKTSEANDDRKLQEAKKKMEQNRIMAEKLPVVADKYIGWLKSSARMEADKGKRSVKVQYHVDGSELRPYYHESYSGQVTAFNEIVRLIREQLEKEGFSSVHVKGVHNRFNEFILTMHVRW